MAHHKPVSTSTAREVVNWVFTILCSFLAMLLIMNFMGRMYYIPSSSMEDTLQINDRVIAEKISYYTADPQVGDVVIFQSPSYWDDTPTNNSLVSRLFGRNKNYMVKRIVATGGDTVRCLPGDPDVLVNGEPLGHDHIKELPDNIPEYPDGSPECGGIFFPEITVPQDHYFMMGDNRTNSADSRYHLDVDQGGIHKDNIVGKVAFIVLPVNRMQVVN